MWAIVLAFLLIFSPLIQLGWYWYVFHLWPVSWAWFFAMAFISYLYSEAIKKTLKEVMKEYGN